MESNATTDVSLIRHLHSRLVLFCFSTYGEGNEQGFPPIQPKKWLMFTNVCSISRNVKVGKTVLLVGNVASLIFHCTIDGTPEVVFGAVLIGDRCSTMT
jgi:hypothetical protein